MDNSQESILPSGLLFKFPKINYTLQTRGDGRDSTKINFNKQAISVCSLLSCAWAMLVLSYAFGIFSTIETEQIASFVYASLFMIIVFPIALIWGGFFVYSFAIHAHQSSAAILDAARMLSSPALIASDDVKSLSSAVGQELNTLRAGMRDLEDQLNGISKVIHSEINALDETGQRLEKTLVDVSGIVRAERDAIVDLMKIVKIENQHAKDYLSNQEKTDIQVNEVPDNIDPNSVISAYIAPRVKSPVFEPPVYNSSRISQLKSEPEKKQYSHSESAFTPSSIHTKNHISEYAQAASSYSIPTIHSATTQAAASPVSSTYQAQHMTSGQPHYQVKPEAVILRRERQLYEGICALAVDLNREIGLTLPQELWSQYMRGERHVFAEHFFNKVSEDFSCFQSKMDTENMRKLSNQFIARFETLRERLYDEPDVAVSEYLENSGIGKVYDLLSVEYV